MILLSLASLLLAAEDGTTRVRIVRDLAYRAAPAGAPEAQAKLQALDLYLPAQGTGFPVMVWFHGGGLEGGDKASKVTAALAQRFATDGVAVASANYRLSPAVQAPAYIEDAAAAVQWVAANIAEHGGDARSLFVAGHSAGGYLAAILGADPRWLDAAGVAQDRVAGFIPVSGQTFTHFTIRKERGIADPENTPVIDAYAPAYHAFRAKTQRPFLVLCGDKDWPARAEENRFFVAMCKHRGASDIAYLQCDGRDHGSIIGRMGEADDPAARAILAFVASHRP